MSDSIDIPQRIALWKEWKQKGGEKPNFIGADLSEANLSGADLSGANLSCRLKNSEKSYVILSPDGEFHTGKATIQAAMERAGQLGDGCQIYEHILDMPPMGRDE